MIEFKCVESICRALKKAYPDMQVNSYGYGDMQTYDKHHKYINRDCYIKANLIKYGFASDYDFNKNCFNMPEQVEFWWNGNMTNITEICDIMETVAKKYGCSIIRPLDRESIKLVEGKVYYILENRWYDGRVDGWFGGWNKKYSDMIDYTSDKKYAYKFDSLEQAEKWRAYFNKNDWNFHIVLTAEYV